MRIRIALSATIVVALIISFSVVFSGVTVSAFATQDANPAIHAIFNKQNEHGVSLLKNKTALPQHYAGFNSELSNSGLSETGIFKTGLSRTGISNSRMSKIALPGRRNMTSILAKGPLSRIATQFIYQPSHQLLHHNTQQVTRRTYSELANPRGNQYPSQSITVSVLPNVIRPNFRTSLINTVVPVASQSLAVETLAPPTDSTSVNTPDWQCIRIHESGDRYNSPAAPSGAYGILEITWLSNGYSGWPYQAPPTVQDQLALKLYSEFGWRPWSTRFMCGL